MAEQDGDEWRKSGRRPRKKQQDITSSKAMMSSLGSYGILGTPFRSGGSGSSGAPSRTESEEKELFSRCQKTIAHKEDGFVDLRSFRRRYEEESEKDPSKKRPNERIYNKWLRVLIDLNKGLEGTIDAALSTHVLLTLHDLQGFILGLKDFKDVKTFEAAELGKLTNHPKIKRYFLTSPVAVSEQSYEIPKIHEIPPIKTHELLSFVFNHCSKRFKEDRQQQRERDASSSFTSSSSSSTKKRADDQADLKQAEKEEADKKCYWFVIEALDLYAKEVTKLPSRLHLCVHVRESCGGFIRFLLFRSQKMQRDLSKEWESKQASSLRLLTIKARKLESERLKSLPDVLRFIASLKSMTPALLNSSSSTSSTPTQGDDPLGVLRKLQRLIRSSVLKRTSTPEQNIETLSAVFLILLKGIDPESNKAQTLTSLTSEERTSRLKVKLQRVLNHWNGESPDLLTLLRTREKHYNATLIGHKQDDTPYVSFLEFVSQLELSAILQTKLRLLNRRSHDSSGDNHDELVRGRDFLDRTRRSLLNHLKSIVNDSNISNFSSMIQYLYDIEKELISISEVRSFEDSGCGTFLKFCAENESEIPSFSVGTTAGGFISSSLRAHRQTSMDDELSTFLKGMYHTFQGALELPQALQAVASHFGLDVTQLSSEQSELKKRLSDLDSGSTGSIPCLHWFVTNQGASPELGILEVRAEEARKVVLSSPYLQDISTWTMWEKLFEPSLGILRAFLNEMFPGGALEGVGILEVQSNVFVLYDCSHSLNPEFVTPGGIVVHGRQVVAWVVGCIVYSKRLDFNELELLKKIITRELARVSIEKRVKLLLESLEAIPTTSLFDVIAYQLFVSPVYDWFSTLEDAQERLLRTCSRPSQRALLHRLGFSQDIQMWKEDFLHFQQSTTSLELSPESIVPELVSPSTTTTLSSATDNITPNPLLEEPQITYDTDSLGEVHPIYNQIMNELGCYLDDQVTEEGRKNLQNLRRMTTIAITRLAGELYAEDVHFLLELIQNADDNSYHYDAIPELSITLSREMVELRNNERGFNEENVKALCSIGESTKAMKSGYIGRKGIGFKSVFKVTDTPQVHSRMFHFYFDKNRTDGLGYVIPIPTSPPQSWSEEEPTRILLRIATQTPGIVEAKGKISFTQIQACLDEITPSVLLFLQKLRKLIVRDDVKQVRREMIREDLGNNRVRLTENKMLSNTQPTPKFEEWMVIRETLEIERKEHKQTEIALAFPLNFLGTSADTLPARKVFAFLPLRDYGFRFVIQADWTTTSSRESIDNADSRNRELREHLSKVFETATSEFIRIVQNTRIRTTRTEGWGVDEEVEDDEERQETEEKQKDEDEDEYEYEEWERTSDVEEEREEVCQEDMLVFSQESIDWINLFFQFIPRPGQVRDVFMLPVVDTIWKGLRMRELIPTIDNRLVRPVQTLDLDVNLSENDAFVDRLQLLLTPLSLSLIHPEAVIPPVLQKELRFQKLDARVIVNLIKIETKTRAKSIESSRVTEFDCRWVVWLLERLTENDFSSVKSELLELEFVPLSNGTWTSFSRGDIYESFFSDSLLQRHSIYRVHQNLLKSLEVRPLAKRTLKLLGMKSLTEHEYVEKFLLTSLKVNKRAHVDHVDVPSVKDCWDFLRFTVAHVTNGKCEECKKQGGLDWLEERLKMGAWWLAVEQDKKESVISSRSEPIHHRVKLETARSWTTISKGYCQELDSVWERTFKALKINKFVKVKKRMAVLSEQNFERIVSQNLSPDQLNNDDEEVKEEMVLEDYYSPELEELLHNPSDMRKLFDLLAPIWESEGYHDFVKCKVVDNSDFSYEGPPPPSSFFGLLLRIAWIPNSKQSLLPPSQLLRQSPKIEQILGKQGDFVKHSPQTPQSFYVDFGIQDTLTFDSLLSLLIRWKSKPDFQSTTWEMATIYKELINLAEKDKENIQEVRDKIPIFVPDYHSNDDSQGEEKGKFYSVDECVRSDPFVLLDRSKRDMEIEDKEATAYVSQYLKPRSLERYYSQSKRLLVQLGVPEKPTCSQYLDIWRFVTTEVSENVSSKGARILAHRLMGGFGWIPCPISQEELGNVVLNLKEHAMIPCYVSSDHWEFTWKKLGPDMFQVTPKEFKRDPEFFLQYPISICCNELYKRGVSHNDNFFRMVEIPKLEDRMRYSYETDVPPESKKNNLVIGLFLVIQSVLHQLLDTSMISISEDQQNKIKNLEVYLSQAKWKKERVIETVKGEVICSHQPRFEEITFDFDKRNDKLYLASPVDKTQVKEVINQLFSQLLNSKNHNTLLDDIVKIVDNVLEGNWNGLTRKKLNIILTEKDKVGLILDQLWLLPEQEKIEPEANTRPEPEQIDEPKAVFNSVFSNAAERIEEWQLKPKRESVTPGMASTLYGNSGTKQATNISLTLPSHNPLSTAPVPTTAPLLVPTPGMDSTLHGDSVTQRATNFFPPLPSPHPSSTPVPTAAPAAVYTIAPAPDPSLVSTPQDPESPSLIQETSISDSASISQDHVSTNPLVIISPTLAPAIRTGRSGKNKRKEEDMENAIRAVKILLVDQTTDPSHQVEVERFNINDSQLLAVGRFAELVVYLYLRERFGIMLKNWVSSNREYYFPEECNPCDDGLGYDFTFQLGAHFYFLEVKGTGRLNDMDWFHISSREWEKAESLHLKPNSHYLVIRVFLNPISIYSFDPLDLVEGSQLTREPSEWLVSVQRKHLNPGLPLQTLSTEIGSKKVQMPEAPFPSNSSSNSQIPQSSVSILPSSTVTSVGSTPSKQSKRAKRREKKRQMQAHSLSPASQPPTPTTPKPPQSSSTSCSQTQTTPLRPTPVPKDTSSVPLRPILTLTSTPTLQESVKPTKPGDIVTKDRVLNYCKEYLMNCPKNHVQLLASLSDNIKSWSHNKIDLKADLKYFGLKMKVFFTKHSDIFELPPPKTTGSDTIRLR